MTLDDKSTDRQLNGFGPDEFSVFMPPRVRPRGLAARHILFAGVAGACVLGVGLGLWARPAMSERQAVAAQPADAPKPPPPTRQLEIVVDDRPAPIGAPLDVLPGKSDARPRIVPPMAVAALLAPKPVAAKARPAGPAPPHLAKVAPAPKPVAKPTHKVELARAAAAKSAAHKLELAQTAKAAKAVRRQQIQLAKAEARGRAEARAEAKAEAVAFAKEDARKRARFANLAHAFQRLLPHQAKPTPVEVAKLDRKHAHKSRHEPRVERASLKTHRPPRLAEPPTRTRAVQVAPSHASGLMKVSAPRCANRDPGQALVCADPSLSAADRQLARAYQGARAAGVSDAQLQHQQQRWLAARSAAAREAPWAVHDVYLARIAELNGQAREAHGDGY